jgi:hypothetical protein
VSDDELSDLTILRLAIGGIFATPALSDLGAVKYAALLKDRTIQQRAEKIACRVAARIIDGEGVDEAMRFLVGVWLRQRSETDKPRRGRPKSDIGQEIAVRTAYIEMIHRDPTAKWESIIVTLAKKFGLNRSRVAALLSEMPRI